MRSFCLQPRYFSVVCTLTWPRRKDLDLLLFAAIDLIETSTRPPQIVRGQVRNLSLRRKFLDDAPDDLLGYAVAPNRAGLVHASEDPAVRHLCGRRPAIHGGFHP